MCGCRTWDHCKKRAPICVGITVWSQGMKKSIKIRAKGRNFNDVHSVRKSSRSRGNSDCFSYLPSWSHKCSWILLGSHSGFIPKGLFTAGHLKLVVSSMLHNLLPKTSWDCTFVLDNISKPSSFTLSCICTTLVPRFLVPQVRIHCDFWILLSGTPPISHVGLLDFGSQVDINTTFYLLC